MIVKFLLFILIPFLVMEGLRFCLISGNYSLLFWFCIISGAPAAEGRQADLFRKVKETHQLIFSWLALLLEGANDDDGDRATWRPSSKE